MEIFVVVFRIKLRVMRSETQMLLLQLSFILLFAAKNHTINLPGSGWKQHQCFMQKGARTHSASAISIIQDEQLRNKKRKFGFHLWTDTLFCCLCFSSSSILSIEMVLKWKVEELFYRLVLQGDRAGCCGVGFHLRDPEWSPLISDEAPCFLFVEIIHIWYYFHTQCLTLL